MESEYVKNKREIGKKRFLNIMNKRKDYKVLSEYRSNKQRIKIQHLKCGYIYSVTVRALTAERGYCPKCWKNPTTIRMGLIFEEYVKNVNGYTLLSEYVNSKEKVKIRHDDCGNVFLVSPNKFKSKKTRCPNCTISIGEEKVKEYLDRKNIEFKREKTFSDMISDNFLRFDFYLPKYNIAIEFNGKQHYQAIDFFGGEDEFVNILRRDKDKKRYCVDNNIVFIEIPYNEKDIQTYLDNQFKLYRNNI